MLGSEQPRAADRSRTSRGWDWALTYAADEEEASKAQQDAHHLHAACVSLCWHQHPDDMHVLTLEASSALLPCADGTLAAINAMAAIIEA